MINHRQNETYMTEMNGRVHEMNEYRMIDKIA